MADSLKFMAIGLYLCAIIFTLPLFFIIPIDWVSFQIIATLAHGFLLALMLWRNLTYERAILFGSIMLLAHVAVVFTYIASLEVLFLCVSTISVYLLAMRLNLRVRSID